MISFSRISKQYGRQVLFVDASFQHNPGEKVGLVGPNGDDMIETQVLNLTDAEQKFTFKNIGARPIPSILRNFSAPVKLTTDLTDEDLRFLMVHDSDGFNRWEAGQTYALRAINRLIDTAEMEEGILDSLESLLDLAVQGKEDKALIARALTLPEIQIIAQTRDEVDPDLTSPAAVGKAEILKGGRGGGAGSPHEGGGTSGGAELERRRTRDEGSVREP